MDDPTTRQNVAETMRDVMTETGKAETLILNPADHPLDAAAIVSKPNGRTLEDQRPKIIAAREFLQPLRRRGTAKITTLESLTDWGNRFKGDHSALYCDTATPSITCIANYHARGPAEIDPAKGEATARRGDHRAEYAFPLSEEWKTWTGVDGKPMGKDDLAAFFGDHVMDMIDPTPAILGTAKAGEAWEKRNIEIAAKIGGRFGQVANFLEMSRAFEVHETSNLTAKTDLATGETSITFESEHKDAGGRPLKIPNLFLIAIPVFDRGDLYRLTVRFIYRKRGGNLTFALSIMEPKRAFDDAVTGAAEAARDATGLPLFYGTPEPAAHH